MRYDDILHQAFIASINGLVSNPINAAVKQETLINQAWNLAALAANKAKNSSTLIPEFRNTAVAAVPADPVVSITPSLGTILNAPTTTQGTTLRPTAVTNPDGTFVPSRG